MKNKLLFEIDGFTVYQNSIYVVRDKEDLSAPSGFIQAGVSKLPSDGVSDSFQCKYVRGKNGKGGVWDTGFNEYSPCYSGMDPELVQEKISMLNENLIDPYRRQIGDDTALKHNDDEFWTKQSFTVFAGKAFDTNDPEDLLTLYFALRAKQVTPKGSEGDSRYSQSSYVIVDITKDVKKKDEKSAKLFKAVGLFESLLNTDKPRLFAILDYLKVTVSKSIEDDSLRGVFNQHLNSGAGSTNIDKFLSLYEKTSKDKGRAEVEIFCKLKEAEKKGTSLTKNPNGVYFYEDKELGPDLKSAASNIAKTKALSDIKDALLLTDED